MARILRNSGNENRHGKVERMASQKNTDVYLEAMEITENKGEELDKARYA